MPIKKVFLEHNQAHSFTYGLYHFRTVRAELKSCHRGCYDLQELKYLLSGPDVYVISTSSLVTQW